MENQLWNVFRETGDPMGYLLYRADGTAKQAAPAAKKPGQETTARPQTDAPRPSV